MSQDQQRMEPVTLKAFSMNCWALPFISKDVQTRLPEIGRYLVKSDVDIVFLQEVWTRKSFELVEAECKDRFPYRRCFFSGRVGTSGMCVFSRFPISDTFYHPFMLNGYWYAFYHGDNYASKGVGFLRIAVGSVVINCFIAHLHAEYDRKNDKYFAHRLAQAYELLKFTHLVVPNSLDHKQNSLTLVAGDLNLEPQDLGLDLLCAGGYNDPWKELHGDRSGATCDCPGNFYTPSSSLAESPEGKRIDYILYRADNISCEVVNSSIDSMKLPGTDIPFSDHEAVTVAFKLSLPEESSPPKTPSPLKTDKAHGDDENSILQQVRQVFRQAIKDCAKLCMYWVYGILLMLLLGLICALFAPSLINNLTVPVYILLMVASLLHYLLVMRQEHVHLIEMVHRIETDLWNGEESGATSD